jgi:hypothetical protein
MIFKPFMLAWLGSRNGVAVAVGSGVAVGAVVGRVLSVVAPAKSDSSVDASLDFGVAVAGTRTGMVIFGRSATIDGAGKAVGRGVLPASNSGSINGILARRTRYSPGNAPTTLGTAVKAPITNIGTSTINERMY